MQLENMQCIPTFRKNTRACRTRGTCVFCNCTSYQRMSEFMNSRTQAEYQSDVGSTKDTPYLALTGELRDVFVNTIRKFTAL